MEAMIRRSPIVFDEKPLNVEARGGWRVVLEYVGEGDGPHLVDLSHRSRWDFQDADLSQYHLWDCDIPDHPGICAYSGGLMINRMNRTQTAIWHLSGEAPGLPAENGFTETTDATLFLALFGPNTFSITEKLTALDLQDLSKAAPFLTQGPFSHVPCQIVTLGTEGGGSGILLTCSRGYARDMVHAVLDAGKEFGLRPAGENAFIGWIDTL